jgi:endonuclease III
MALLPDAIVLLLVVVFFLVLLVAVVLAQALRTSRHRLKVARERMREMLDPSEDMISIRLKRLEHSIERLDPRFGRPPPGRRR